MKGNIKHRGAWQNPETDKFKLRPAVEMYIACQEFDFSFIPSEVEKVKMLWRYGLSVYNIGVQLKRPAEEIMILLIDLSSQGKIQRRQGGALGNIEVRV
jgi:hypothetical protein